MCYESLLAPDNRMPITDPTLFSARFYELCQLAFLFNAFTGVEEDEIDPYYDRYLWRFGEPRECDYYGIDFEYTGVFDSHPARIEFTFNEPTRLEPIRKHIIAYSRQQLGIWLRGKVSGKERKRLPYPRHKGRKATE